MTRCFSTNTNNDIFIDTDGRLAISSRLQAVLDLCEHAVKAQLGEMVLAVNQGIPNFQTIWNGAPNTVQFAAYIRRAILSVDGVLEIVTLNTEPVADVMTYSATIRTIYGQGDIGG